MPVLKKGCFCGELETCASVVGWIGVLFGLLSIFGYYVAGYNRVDTLVYIVIGICHLFITALLIRATKDKKPNLVIPWLIVVVAETIGLIVAQVVVLVQHPQGNDMVAATIIALVVLTAFIIYIWLCIYSYYQFLSNK